ncbi:hypothetical protein D3C71_1193660 [compost metagenome]
MQRGQQVAPACGGQRLRRFKDKTGHARVNPAQQPFGPCVGKPAGKLGGQFAVQRHHAPGAQRQARVARGVVRRRVVPAGLRGRGAGIDRHAVQHYPQHQHQALRRGGAGQAAKTLGDGLGAIACRTQVGIDGRQRARIGRPQPGRRNQHGIEAGLLDAGEPGLLRGGVACRRRAVRQTQGRVADARRGGQRGIGRRGSSHGHSPFQMGIGMEPRACRVRRWRVPAARSAEEAVADCVADCAAACTAVSSASASARPVRA